MKIVFLIAFVMIAVQSKGFCQANTTDTSKIMEITYSSTIGELGGQLELVINKDSTHYLFTSSRRATKQIQEPKIINEKTDYRIWHKLIKAIKLSDFDKAPNGENTAGLDGVDYYISIDTKTNTHTLLLGNFKGDEYKDIQKFISLIFEYNKKLQSQ